MSARKLRRRQCDRIGPYGFTQDGLRLLVAMVTSDDPAAVAHRRRNGPPRKGSLLEVVERVAQRCIEISNEEGCDDVTEDVYGRVVREIAPQWLDRPGPAPGDED